MASSSSAEVGLGFVTSVCSVSRSAKSTCGLMEFAMAAFEIIVAAESPPSVYDKRQVVAQVEILL